MMNVKKFARYFPEIAHLPLEEQHRLLNKAYQDAFSPDNKMRNWGSNLIIAVSMSALCFLFVLVIRPALGISQQASAILLMVIAFPAYLLFQHQRMLRQVRVSLQKFLP